MWSLDDAVGECSITVIRRCPKKATYQSMMFRIFQPRFDLRNGLLW
jgi:hypothetical protein